VILITEDKIKNRVKELGREIRNDYKGKQVVLICVLKGSVFFMTDLARELDETTTEIDFMQISSYKGTESTGKINLINDITSDLKGKNAIVVEDIIDTGLTLDFLINHINSKKPESLKICSFLNKNKINYKIDYTGFEIPNEFVIGYGLDFDGKYRNLPNISIFKQK